ncbi:hypothetical protein [Candidatus Solincola sp.]|nr:hypothetical protein [Actinomycetota bacterium]
MEVYRYFVELQDFLFYAQEAVAGTVTPRWLHATAMNYALAYVMNIIPEEQPYLMRSDGGRNVPAYKSSLIPKAGFYATAAGLDNMSRAKLSTFLVKGDGEGYGYITGKGGEVLRVSRVSMLPPGTVFKGFIISSKRREFPSRIRLGRFRIPTRLGLTRGEVVSRHEKHVVDHPVDPLVTKVKKGVLVPILPYPLVVKAYLEDCLVVRFDEGTYYVAAPDFLLSGDE